MLLVRFEVEWLTVLQAGKAAILSLAAVTLQQVADGYIQQDIDERRAEQHAVGPERQAVVPEDGADNSADDNDCDAQRLRKVLPHEQLRAGADDALLKIAPGRRARRNRPLRLTMGARNV